MCGHCIHDNNITENKNPLVLPEEKFNGFDCITHSKAFGKVYLNKAVPEAVIGACPDLQCTHITFANKNYRFIAYKQYICDVLWEEDGHMYAPYSDITF